MTNVDASPAASPSVCARLIPTQNVSWGGNPCFLVSASNAVFGGGQSDVSVAKLRVHCSNVLESNLACSAILNYSDPPETFG
jgi:hypothetical protein